MGLGTGPRGNPALGGPFARPGQRSSSAAGATPHGALACLTTCLPWWVQGGTVVNADQQLRADVLIRGELIESVGPDLVVRAPAHRGAASWHGESRLLVREEQS